MDRNSEGENQSSKNLNIGIIRKFEQWLLLSMDNKISSLHGGLTAGIDNRKLDTGSTRRKGCLLQS